MQLVVAIRVTSILREGKYGEEAWAPPATDLVGELASFGASVLTGGR
jgi:hypothetical protein